MRSIMHAAVSCFVLLLLLSSQVCAQTANQPAQGQPGQTQGQPSKDQQDQGQQGQWHGKQQVVGVTSDEAAGIAKGWSAKKDILDKDVYNQQDEKVGEISDVIVNPEKALSYAIVGVGGFLGLGTRDIAVPINQLQIRNKRLYIPWATKDALQKQPEFKYSR